MTLPSVPQLTHLLDLTWDWGTGTLSVSEVLELSGYLEALRREGVLPG